MTANPYESFADYWAAGWRGILPLPYGKKTWPPEGFTGYGGAEPSYADCHAWSEGAPRNLCVRVPDGCVGIDVDHYDGKTGGDTLTGLVDKYGALPPTAYSTSRGDGISGIRLYRVPLGTTLPTKLPGIEFIQRHHRYVVAWPSVHPSGNVYRWIDERTGAVMDTPPRLADLPELPTAWITGLAVEAKNYDKVALDLDAASAILAGFPLGDPCAHVLAHAGKTMAGGDRHDSYNEAALAVVGSGRRGCPGAAQVLHRLRAAFVAEVSDPRNGTARRTVPEAEAEWRRGLLGALAIVANEEQGTACPDDVFVWMDDLDAQEKAKAEDEGTDEAEEATEPSPYDMAVRRKLADLIVHEAAKEALATRKAGQAPPLDGHDLPTFLAQPDEGERYRVDRLWPSEGRVLLPAAAKSGKTTLIVGNLIPSLVDGSQFLGMFDVDPVKRRVVYFNLEVGERTLRAWMRRANIAASNKVTVVNLRGKVSALGLNSEAGRKRLTDFLTAQDAEVVILDPLAPALAAYGLDENSNSDVATFFGWWSEALGRAGVVDDLIAHHAGHAGERSRGASRLLDEPDAIWTMTKSASTVDEDDVYGPAELRFLQAVGRDVEEPATGLAFDRNTGRLTLTGLSKKAAGKAQSQATLETRILDYVGANEGCSREDIKAKVKGGNTEKWVTVDRLIGAGKLDVVVVDGRSKLTIVRPVRDRPSSPTDDSPPPVRPSASLDADAGTPPLDGKNGTPAKTVTDDSRGRLI
jgi:hypothetical protein